jgi:hypothetical protein
LNSILNLNI